MDIKKILKIVVTIMITLSSIFQVRPAFTNDVLNIMDSLSIMLPDISYEVMFDLNGGSGSFPQQIVNHGAFAEMPLDDPIRAGHDFIGWFTAAIGGSEFDFTQPITEDTVIYARWRLRSVPPGFFMVNFELNGGVFTLDFDSQIVRFLETLTRPVTDPVREGYIFIGWFTAATGGSEFDFDMPMIINRSPYAQWAPVLYAAIHEVTFELNGGSGSFLNQVVGHGNFAEMPLDEPVRVGYRFIGWFTHANDPFDFLNPITENTVIYAQWIPATGPSDFTIVNFELNGGVRTPDFNSQIVQFSRRATRPAVDPVREGYRFTGWFTSEIDGSEFDFNRPINSGDPNMTIHAQWQWEPIPVSHVITFDLNGGSGFFPVQVVGHGNFVEVPLDEPVRAGYEFIGWFTDSYGHVLFDFSIPITGSTVIYAQWYPEVVSHVVTFDFNGGNGVIESSPGTIFSHSIDVAVIHGNFIQEPYNELGMRISRANYELVGWSTVVNSSSDRFNFSTSITRTMTLYALWEYNPGGNNPGGNNPGGNNPGGNNPGGNNPGGNNPGGNNPGGNNPEGNNPGGNNPGGNNPGGNNPGGNNPGGNNPEGNNPGGNNNSNSDRDPNAPPIIIEGPPESSGITMEVNADGAIVITGLLLGDDAIMISGAFLSIEFDRLGELGEMFFLFPGCTEPEEVDITVPTEWTYEYYHDVPGNLVYAFLPPGVDLATVLSDPLNPQPRDRSIIGEPELTEDDSEQAPSEEYPQRTPETEDPNGDMIDQREEDVDETSMIILPETAWLSSSVALVGVMLVKCIHLLFDLRKKS